MPSTVGLFHSTAEEVPTQPWQHGTMIGRCDAMLAWAVLEDDCCYVPVYTVKINSEKNRSTAVRSFFCFFVLCFLFLFQPIKRFFCELVGNKRKKHFGDECESYPLPPAPPYCFGSSVFACSTAVVLQTPQTDNQFPLQWSWSFKTDVFPILYDLAHAAGWDPYNLHDLAHASCVGSVLCRSCTTPHNGRWGTRWSRSWSVRGDGFVVFR